MNEYKKYKITISFVVSATSEQNAIFRAVDGGDIDMPHLRRIFENADIKAEVILDEKEV